MRVSGLGCNTNLILRAALTGLKLRVKGLGFRSTEVSGFGYPRG